MKRPFAGDAAFFGRLIACRFFGRQKFVGVSSGLLACVVVKLKRPSSSAFRKPFVFEMPFMETLPPPQTSKERGVYIVAPGPEYSSIYEGVLSEFDAIVELAKTQEPPLMLLDLQHTRYVGSAFLGLLLRLSNVIRVQRQGRFGVCNLTKFCKTLFATTKMDTHFELFETREDALATFAPDQA